MTFKKIALAAIALGTIGMAAPASAWGWGGSSTSGWHGSSSGGHHGSSSGGHHGSSSGWSGSSSGGHGSSSGGTKVPEPGMLGIFGAGVLAVGLSRARRRRKA